MLDRWPGTSFGDYSAGFWAAAISMSRSLPCEADTGGPADPMEQAVKAKAHNGMSQRTIQVSEQGNGSADTGSL